MGKGNATKAKAARAAAPAPAAEPQKQPEAPTISKLQRCAAVLLGAAVVGLSPGSQLRVERLCAGGALASTRFCGLPVGKRVAVCASIFATIMLADVVALVLKSFAKLLAAAPAFLGEFLVEVVTELAEHLRMRRAAAAARRRQRAREAEGRSHDERLRHKKAAAEAEWRRARDRKPPKAAPKPFKAGAPLTPKAATKLRPRKRSPPPEKSPGAKAREVAEAPPEEHLPPSPGARPGAAAEEAGVEESKGCPAPRPTPSISLESLAEAAEPKEADAPRRASLDDAPRRASLDDASVPPSELTEEPSTEPAAKGGDPETRAARSDSRSSSSLGREEEDLLYAQLDASRYSMSSSVWSERRRGGARLPITMAALVGIVVLTTVVEVGWLVVEHLGRSAAVQRALETALVLRVCRAVHETQRERGLLSTYIASGGRANALELGQQFLRTDAALDLTVGAILRHADTVRPARGSVDNELSPKRTAALLGPAVDLAARRSAYVDQETGGPPARLRSLQDPGCRRKACRRLRALLLAREDRARGSRPRNRTAAGHVAAFDDYSHLNDQLLTVARDACVELMRAGLRAQHLAPSLFASVSLAAYKEHVAVERGLVSADLGAASVAKRKPENPVTTETLVKLNRVVTLQDGASQTFLAFAPRSSVRAFAKHSGRQCVLDAIGLRSALLAGLGARGSRTDAPSHDRWFALQSCRVDSLQVIMDELQHLVHADALDSQRRGLWRLVTLGLPLVAILLGVAYVGLSALASLIAYQESVSERIKSLKSSEKKYKKLLLAWAPLSAWVSAVDDDLSAAADSTASTPRAD